MGEEISVYVVRFGNRPNFALQWRDPITRKLKTKTTKIPASRLARDRKAAERLAGELQAQLAAGSAAIPSKFTWAEFHQRYEREVVPGLAKETANKIAVVFNHVESILSPACGIWTNGGFPTSRPLSGPLKRLKPPSKAITPT